MSDIIINGEPRTVRDGLTISELLTLLGAPDRGVAVAVDATVVPRSAWDDVVVDDDARIEVLTAVQGG
jgi:sulfur carrier protein